jgi:Uma2 family endonuclease
MSIANLNTLPSLADAALGAIPPLQTGDHLTRDEFERRYHAMPKKYRAELIEGIVYVMGPPVSDPGHSRPHFRFITWLGVYEAHTPGVAGGDNGTIRLDLKNEPQPDTFLRILPAFGGQTRDTEDKYIEGAPELVAEIAGSSVSYDLHEKLEAYRRNGVREYIVWRVWDNAIDWFQLRGGQYVPQIPDGQAVIKSTAFPGLWLDVAAMLGGQSAKVLALLQQGLASPEHQQFVQKLQAQGGGANA